MVTQKEPDTDAPKQDDCYGVGTLASVMQFFGLADGTSKMLVEGLAAIASTRSSSVTARLWLAAPASIPSTPQSARLSRCAAS